MSPLKSVLKGVKLTRNSISEESKKEPSRFKKALTNPLILLNTVMLISFSSVIGLNSYDSHQEKDLVNGNYNVSFENFQVEDRYVFSINEMITDLALNNKNVILIDYDIENNSSPQASYDSLVDTECTIYMHNPNNPEILHSFTKSDFGYYKDSYDFNTNIELKALLESFILAHEGVHCAEHTSKTLSEIFFKSYNDTNQEIEADREALNFLHGVLDTQTEEGFEKYSQLVKTVITGRMLNELENLSYLISMDKDLTATSLQSDYGVKLQEMRERLQIEPIEVSYLPQLDTQKEFFGSWGSKNDEEQTSQSYFNDEETFTHYTSMGIINIPGSFYGYEFTVREHIRAYEKLHSIMIENDGIANLWTEVGSEPWILQDDQVERMVLSMISLAADESTPNNVRKLIMNYLSITETLDFSLPENIDIQKMGDIEGNTTIKLVANGKMHSLSADFPSLITVDRNGNIVTILTAHNGKVSKINDYSSTKAMDSISHHESFFHLRNNNTDPEEILDQEFYALLENKI